LFSIIFSQFQSLEGILSDLETIRRGLIFL